VCKPLTVVDCDHLDCGPHESGCPGVPGFVCPC
jgi:hypothetical protein